MTLTDREEQKWCRGARLQESLSYDEKPSSSHILQLHSHSSPGIPASCFLLCSATISALHPRWTPQHAIARAHRQEHGWTVRKLWLKIQIRHPRTSSYKLNLQRALHLHCLHTVARRTACFLWAGGQGHPTGHPSLKNSSASARQWLTALISQG